ncbi:type II toxin-antitoxin system HicA family toxin [Phascolarctobacterium succinatutens]|uniref:type II toxin-antitoxin system HicA family toxin n=1 Tax=Phascolarctobacterium succinatutens TaxID=626940 RepID=UPI00265DB5DB|nr:type II toxin-antitoxin system HicA family toxin [Phascolarctobacterium succinatutens]
MKMLSQAGFKLERDDGDHSIYKKPGSRSVQVPRHRELNELTAKAILKAAGVK